MNNRSIILIVSTLLAFGLTAPTGIEDGALSALESRADRTPEKQKTNPTNQDPGRGEKKAPFPLDEYLQKWVEDNTEKLGYAAFTDGGWESWMQYEFDFHVKEKTNIGLTKQVREVNAYGGNTKLKADFVFPPPNDKTKGLIVELKCENKNTYNGENLIKAVKEDVKKLQGEINEDYDKYERVVIAMAYSEKAQSAFGTTPELKEMLPLSFGTVKMPNNKGTLKIYRLDIEAATPDDDTPDISGLDVNCKRADAKCKSKAGSGGTTTSNKDKTSTNSSKDKTDTTSKTKTNENTSTTSKTGKSGKSSSTGSTSKTSKSGTTSTKGTNKKSG